MPGMALSIDVDAGGASDGPGRAIVAGEGCRGLPSATFQDAGGQHLAASRRRFCGRALACSAHADVDRRQEGRRIVEPNRLDRRRSVSPSPADDRGGTGRDSAATGIERRRQPIDIRPRSLLAHARLFRGGETRCVKMAVMPCVRLTTTTRDAPKSISVGDAPSAASMMLAGLMSRMHEADARICSSPSSSERQDAVERRLRGRRAHAPARWASVPPSRGSMRTRPPGASRKS